MEAFQEWDKRDLEFVRRHEEHAQKGQSLLIPDLPRKAAVAVESDAQEQTTNPIATHAGANHTTSSTNQEAQVNIATTNAQTSRA